MSTDEVLKRLATDPKIGLSSQEAERRLGEFGPNALEEGAKRSVWQILAAQFKSLMVLLLVAATIIALSLGEKIEAAAIFAVIIINALIGFFTEWRAEVALSALQKQADTPVRVRREGEELEIRRDKLVPGDLLLVQAGERIGADARLIEAANFETDESLLTGESTPVGKNTESVPENAVVAERTNVIFLATVATRGRAVAIVTTTGNSTEVGKIGALLKETAVRESPLERRLSELGRKLVWIVLGLCGVVVLAGWLRSTQDFWHILEIGISLAIAAVPEGLPAVVTMTLALGMQRMARRNALVRRLSAIETLGSTTVICTDKTGTITKNEMTVTTVALSGASIEVTGQGYSAKGEFREQGQTINVRQSAALHRLLVAGALCNDASTAVSEGKESISGDPTEAALVVAAEKAGLDWRDLRESQKRKGEIPFTSESRFMATVHAKANGHLACVKGALREVLDISTRELLPNGEEQPINEEDRKRWYAVNHTLAEAGLRVLALADRTLPESFEEADLKRDLTFLGLVGMLDPLREGAQQAAEICRTAGVRIIMLTGDQLETAKAIGTKFGILNGSGNQPAEAVHGRDIENHGDEQLAERIRTAGVFARVSPQSKLRIVESLQKNHEIVAMTGDGVNDAPALRKADIGIAMGIKGTDVAKQASAMIILDDNFATIVAAVEQGRNIYSNIQRFIHYLFSCNLSEILTVFVAVMVGGPAPLHPLQILWLNMITDVFPAMALALERSSGGVMSRPPRDPAEPLLPKGMVKLVIWQGALLAAVTLGAFAYTLYFGGESSADHDRAVTVAFLTLGLAQLFHTFNVRSRRQSLISGLFRNWWLWAAVAFCFVLQIAAVHTPLLNRVLHTVPLSASDWTLVLGFSIAPVVLTEILKALFRSRAAPQRSTG